MKQAMNIEQFNSEYEDLIFSVYRNGIEEKNERTGKVIKIYPYGNATLNIDLSLGQMPVLFRRKVFPGTAAAEIAWFLQGTQDASFILKHAKAVWEKFLEPIYSYPRVEAAYGYRWREHFGRDQLQNAIAALEANPSDRRIYISAWDPHTDGLGIKNQMNVPCPVGFTLSIVGGKLNSSLFIRSSDLFVGLPYDIMGHAILMASIAKTLKVSLGILSVSLAHPHLYDSHFDMVKEYLNSKKCVIRMPIIPWTIQDITDKPDEFVFLYKQTAKYIENWPEYSPKPEVVQ